VPRREAVREVRERDLSREQAGRLATAYQRLARAHLRYAQRAMQTGEFPGDLTEVAAAEKVVRALRWEFGVTARG
jgi:hypothetical protein